MMAKESKGGWGNWIGYILLPFTIALQNDPLDYIRVAKATIDRRKHSLEAFCTFSTAKFVLYTFGAKVHTIDFYNIPYFISGVKISTANKNIVEG